MIDHVSIGVRSLDKAKVFYEGVLAPLGFKLLADQSATVGFGKKYPEFWLNHRPDNPEYETDLGCHVCLRAKESHTVDRVYARAIEMGAESSGEPGFRPEYHDSYYACFFRDSDRNHIEVVTFVQRLPGHSL